jgi:hypothetical protein
MKATLIEAKIRWHGHTKNLLTKEAELAFNTKAKWGIEDKIPYIVSSDRKYKFYFHKTDSGVVFASIIKKGDVI